MRFRLPPYPYRSFVTASDPHLLPILPTRAPTTHHLPSPRDPLPSQSAPSSLRVAAASRCATQFLTHNGAAVRYVRIAPMRHAFSIWCVRGGPPLVPSRQRGCVGHVGPCLHAALALTGTGAVPTALA